MAKVDVTRETCETDRMSRKHIFCVNGDPAFLDLLRELFQDANYNVTTTNFVPRTFEQVEALRPDLIVVDLVIGEYAGFDLLEQLTLHAATNGIPVVAVSTMDHLLEYAQNNAERYGTNRYRVKPLDIKDLLETVDEILGVYDR
jgi:CheY-like chemotaxis protein